MPMFSAEPKVAQNNSKLDIASIAIAALLSAAAMQLSLIQIPLFPEASYLSYDPSGALCVIAGCLFGPGIGLIVALVSFLPWAFMIPFGYIMGVLANVSFMLPVALIYQRNKSIKALAIGLILASFCSTAVAILGNLVITPLYTGAPLEAVIDLIVPVLTPFNLLKAVLNSVLILICFKPIQLAVKTILKR